MRYMVFTDKFVDGVVAIDQDHVRMIEIVNQLYRVVLETKSAEALASVFDELETYIAAHFAHEEELMARVEYPKLAEHRAGHATMTRRIADYRARLRDRYDTIIAADMLHQLKAWISGHMMTADKDVCAYLNACGIR
jgi:methyl-accepting chemotaxis protein/hemerythrin